MHGEDGADKIPDLTPLAQHRVAAALESSHHAKLLCCSDDGRVFEGYFQKGLLHTCHVKSRAADSPSGPALSPVLHWAAQPLGLLPALLFSCA